MIGRQDLTKIVCPSCNGSGKDKRNRKRPCPRCEGYKYDFKCSTCGEMMPCSGTDLNMFDQSTCLHYPKKN